MGPGEAIKGEKEKAIKEESEPEESGKSRNYGEADVKTKGLRKPDGVKSPNKRS